MALLHGRAGCLAAQNGGFRPGHSTVAYETEVSFTVKVSGDAAAAAIRTQLADTSSSGPMRAMLASAGVATTGPGPPGAGR
jgi:hypothetical protein